MKIDGRCHCGYITYEAEIDPEKVMICHCIDCQTLSGSAFRTVVFTHEDTFKLLSGELKIYVKTGERGGPGCLNRFSASISGASAGVRLPCGGARGSLLATGQVPNCSLARNSPRLDDLVASTISKL
jgi:hypothetical protein